MSSDWSRVEVEATVSAYLEMLDLELRGTQYSKTESRRSLLERLDARSNTAVERKHQNISAILIELGCQYIQGYKPLYNYQRLLFDVVEERLATSPALHALLRESAIAPATVPTVDDILRRLVDPPRIDRNEYGRQTQIRDAPILTRRVDYLALEARNRSLGLAGETFAMNFEIARLLFEGSERLAARVDHVSTRGDGLGYDILSFESSGAKRLIEVKTTAGGNRTPFYVTRNELEVSSERAPIYHVYRVFDFRNDPRLFVKKGAIGAEFRIEAVEWVARV